MSKHRSKLAMESLKLSLEIRNKSKIDIRDSFCVYDLVEQEGIELKFVDIPSLEGMYIAKPKETILISSHRPFGRQRFTCAHELGHHFYKHGMHIDEFICENNRSHKDQKEILADLFAAYLLMPSSTLNSGFVRRGWKTETATPSQVYTIACWLGVGYTTLIKHMQHSLNKITSFTASILLKQAPKNLKKEFLGNDYQGNVIPVDLEWSGRPVDLYLGDAVLFSEEIVVDSGNLIEMGCVNHRKVYQAIRPGIGSACCPKNGWATFIRVSKSNYNGRGKFRHLEDE